MRYHAVSSEKGLWAVRDSFSEALDVLKREFASQGKVVPSGEWKAWGGAEWMAVSVGGKDCSPMLWREEAPEMALKRYRFWLEIGPEKYDEIVECDESKAPGLLQDWVNDLIDSGMEEVD